MNRRMISLLLAAAMLLALAGCGAAPAKEEPAPETASPAPTAVPAPEPTPTPTSAPTPEPTPAMISYADIYLQYLTVFTAVADEVERRIETHNAVLESRYPDSYYMNSNYLMQVFLPFRPAYPALGSALTDDRTEQARENLRSFYPDAELTMTSPGVYEATFTYDYTDPTSGEVTVHRVRCLWECADGALRVRAWQDDALAEFTEFIPQGGDRYLIYTMTDKILAEYRDGVVASLRYAHRISEAPLGVFPGDMRPCSLEERDFFPAGSAEEGWITDDPDAQYVLVLDANEMVFSGKVSQDVLDARGDKVGVSWQEIEPIQLLKQ